MKNRLVGLDEHHIDLLHSLSTWGVTSRIAIEKGLSVPERWTWLDDYLNDIISRGYVDKGRQENTYRLTPAGRMLQTLSIQYNDEPGE